MNIFTKIQIVKSQYFFGLTDTGNSQCFKTGFNLWLKTLGTGSLYLICCIYNGYYNSNCFSSCCIYVTVNEVDKIYKSYYRI